MATASTQKEPALFGRDPEKGLLAVHRLRGSAAGEGEWMRLYRRNADGVATPEDARYHPFFFLSDIRLLQSFPRDRYRAKRLDGQNYYRYLVVFETLDDYWNAARSVREATGRREGRTEEIYMVSSPVTQYLMQTGRTLFKGMPFDDMHRLQLDIEVYSERGFPQASRPGDRIIIIALSDNRGWVELIDGRAATEAEMLEACVRVIREKDPDVIEGHNIFSFDLPYLTTRCRQYGVPFAIGRDGSEPRTYASSIRFAERSIDYPAHEIAGRHVVDTLFQVMAFDVFKRNMPGYGLKTAARYFGFARGGRTYVEGDEIARVWREDPERLLAYAADDVLETERLARHLSGSTFYLTQMLPVSYGRVARTGPASKIEALFVREYLHARHALPRSRWGSQTVGGYTDVFITGVVGPVVYADVESLYPSIMLNYDVKPKHDELGLFQTFLRKLTELRLETKAAMRHAVDEERRSELDARQTSYKNLINSFYGSLGFGMALFNDFSEADRVAYLGQTILRMMIEAIRKEGGRVVEVDTDGVLFVPPDEVRGEDAEVAFVERLSEAMPSGIRIGFDGRFRKMLSYKKKNYALLTYDGTIKFKGSSLVARSNERFGRRFVRGAIACLLEEDVEGLHRLYLQVQEQIRTRSLPVDDFCRTETLKDTVEEYLRAVQSGKRSRAASYELAIARSHRTGRPVRKGDRITYYVVGAGPNVTTYDHARLAEEWDPDHPDENVYYYLKRLSEFAGKFEPFFREADFVRVFPEEEYGQSSMFAVTLEGVRLVSSERAPEAVRDDVPF